MPSAKDDRRDKQFVINNLEMQIENLKNVMIKSADITVAIRKLQEACFWIEQDIKKNEGN